ncbi:MAG: ABC transporter ATP-binding protein [Hyphomicrobiales bacterium]|nr:ABC transporter ATP-binding protein [Hyphomicrobiales bacterium]
MSASTPILRFDGVSKNFADIVAVDNVSIDVAPGEFFALLGPSGCGKTTLMRIAAGFERPDRGRVLIGGVDVTELPPHRRPVNMMFQSYALFPHMSVFDNIAFGLKRDGVARTQIAERVAEMVRLAQLQGLEKRKPDQLSGGQRQRAALARALARRPKLLLLDEPLGALDRKLREETQFELMDIQKKLGTAFVVVTHDQDEAMSMADRIALMRAGRIEQIGAPPQIYERPTSRFAAEFIGEINLFEVRSASYANGRAHIETPEGAIEAACENVDRIGAPAIVAVRPERLRFAADDGGVNRLAAVVHDIAYRGDRRIFRVRLSSGKLARLSASAAEATPAPGAEIVVTFDPDACVLLDA